MRTIIAGSRTVHSPTIVTEAVAASGFTITEVVSGTAKGVDRLGEVWATSQGIPIKKFPADWRLYDRGAGYVRNAKMAMYAEALIAIWDGQSKGTAGMIGLARDQKLEVYVHWAD